MAPTSYQGVRQHSGDRTASPAAPFSLHFFRGILLLAAPRMLYAEHPTYSAAPNAHSVGCICWRNVGTTILDSTATSASSTVQSTELTFRVCVNTE